MKIEEEIIKVVAECLEMPVEALDCNADMEDVDGWDSMRNVIILSALEEHFDVLIPEEDIFDLTSVNLLVEEIKKLVK